MSLSLVLLALLAAPQDRPDPELGPDGRARYLGRPVAQTMHWTGAPWLLRATREDEENGVLLRRWLAVRPGEVVCDLGCGNGYHTLPLADAVGSTGKVFAVDLQPQMLQLLGMRAKGKGLANLTLVEATVDDPKLPPGSCDLVLLVDVYHELSHPVRVMGHVRRALKPGGRIVLVEFRAEDPAVPIKPEHTMTKAQVIREMAEHGLALVDAFDGLPWQHAMAFAAVDAPGPRFAAQQVLRGLLAAVGGEDKRIVPPYLAAAPAVPAAPGLPPLTADLRTELRAGPDGRILASLGAADGTPLAHGRDEAVLGRDDEGRWFVEAVRRPAAMPRSHGAKWPFVAMHTGLGSGTMQEQAALVRELGFDGVAWDCGRLPEVRRVCEALGGDVYSAYAVLDLGADAGERLQPLYAAMQALAGGPGMLWLALRQDGKALRDASGDNVAAQALTALLAQADATGVEIALYPHHGFWLETTEDALRLCARLDHQRLGVCFNLCHFLRTGDEPAAPLLARCGRRLFAVTVNGADVAGTDWHQLIRPLGDGDFDLRALLATLTTIGFDGPVGLQAFGIDRPPRAHLEPSMKAWRAAQ